jgi:hypothetical protein
VARFGRSFPLRPVIRHALDAGTTPGGPRSTAETVAGSDSTTRAVAYGRSISETAGGADSTSWYWPRSTTEAVGGADGTSRLVTYPRSLSESVGGVDLTSQVLVGAGQPATLANPNWPLVGFEVDFTSGPPGRPTGARNSINAVAKRLFVRRWSTSRGRQYELDQVQAGTAELDLPDPLELLNPDNGNSPFNGATTTGGTSPGSGVYPGGDTFPLAGTTTTSNARVTPYRAAWIWAMWPNQPGSGNIINPTVWSGYDPGFEGTTSGWVPVDVGTTAALSTVQKHSGAKSMLVTQGAAGASFGVVNGFRTAPDVTYTFSVWVYPTNGTVTCGIMDAAGNWHQGTATTAVNAWTRIYVAWNPVDTLEDVYVYGSGATTPTFYVDEQQLEFGSTLTAWQATGPSLYPIITGYAERFPTSWDMGGVRAQKPMTLVDGLAIMSRATVKQDYESVLSGLGPIASMPLDNASAPAGQGQLGTGTGATPVYYVPQSSQINWAGDSHPDGHPAVTFTQQNPENPPSRSGSLNDTYMEPIGGRISMSTTGSCFVIWIRPAIGAWQAPGLYVAPGASNFPTDSTHVQLAIRAGDGTTEEVYYRYRPVEGGASITTAIAGGGRLWQDNQWHMHLLGFDATGGWMRGTDNLRGSSIAVGSQPAQIGFNVAGFFSASTGFGYPQSQMSTGRFAVFNRLLTLTEQAALYWRGIGYSGVEDSGARAIRLLNQWWGGSIWVDAGTVKLAADFSYDGRTLLDVLQEVAETERGLVYMTKEGNARVESRRSRYANQTALWTFGENPAGASPTEYPYQDLTTDHDPTYVFSQANLSRPDNSAIAPMVNSAAEATYGQRILTQTLQVTTDFDVEQAGVHYLARYGSPKTRVTKLTLKPSANPALWPVVLSLEISQRVRVNRRSMSLTTSREYYIEKIDHRVDGETGDWTVDLQLSPVFVPSAWVLGDSTLGVLGTSTTPVY